MGIEVWTCRTCKGERCCEARVWTPADAERVRAAKHAEAEKKRAREERRERERILTDRNTHWRRIPMPEGWSGRRSLKHGWAVFRGDTGRRAVGGTAVRVVDCARRTGSAPDFRGARYRVDTLNRETGKWEPLRNEKGRVIHTRVLENAYDMAIPLYAPSEGEVEAEALRKAEENAIDKLREYVKENKKVLLKWAHPSHRARRSSTLYDWALWILDNRPTDAYRVQKHVLQAVIDSRAKAAQPAPEPSNPMEPPFPATETPQAEGNVADALVAVADNLVAGMTAGADTGLTDSNAALKAALENNA
jgi:hypothetical protein